MRRGARMIGVVVAVLVAVVTVAGQTAEKRAITFKDLISLHRLSEPQISPDGKWIAYSVATPDLEANHAVRDIWVVATAGGGEARQLTRGGSDTRPRWSPDGKKLAFISGRAGTPQIYWIALEGGEATRLTSISTGADNEIVVAGWEDDGVCFVAYIRIARTMRATRSATRQQKKAK